MPPPRRHSSSLWLLRAGDAALVALAVCLGSGLWPPDEFLDRLQLQSPSRFGAMAIALVTMVLALGRAGYRGLTLFRRLQQMCIALGALLLMEAFLAYGRIPLQLELRAVPETCFWSALLLALWYGCNRLLFRPFIPRETWLLYGDDPALRVLKQRLASEPGKFEIVGPLRDADEAGRTLERNPPDRIVFGLDGLSPDSAARVLEFRNRGFLIDDAAELYERFFERVSLTHLRPARLVFGEPPPRAKNVALQSVYSNLAGMVVLVLASPLLLLVLLAIKLSDPARPAIEQTSCAGVYGIPFTLLRFHSRSALGRWFARLSLTEWPLLINVVRGDLSLVGPRPHRLEYSEELQARVPAYRQRLSVRPGLTGLARIRGAGTDVLEELEYDLYYIETLSPGFDLEILGTALLAKFALPR